MDFQRWNINYLPVSVSIHNTRSPFLSVIHQLDGSLQCLSGFVDDAVSNLETTNENAEFCRLSLQVFLVIIESYIID